MTLGSGPSNGASFEVSDCSNIALNDSKFNWLSSAWATFVAASVISTISSEKALDRSRKL